MKKVLVSILLSGSLITGSLAYAQTSMNSDEMLRNNERVMDTLMQKIQRNSDLSDRQSLIIEHMKLMDIYLSSLEKRIRSESDSEQRELLQEIYKQGLQRSLVLIDSGIRDSKIVMMGKTVDEHLLFIEKRMEILQSLMAQVTSANSFMGKQTNN
tara:strand:- start:184 stop:648 length:465 start_codon:yes stop_codon:yes gene_type:complete